MAHMSRVMHTTGAHAPPTTSTRSVAIRQMAMRLTASSQLVQLFSSRTAHPRLLHSTHGQPHASPLLVRAMAVAPPGEGIARGDTTGATLVAEDVFIQVKGHPPHSTQQTGGAPPQWSHMTLGQLREQHDEVLDPPPEFPPPEGPSHMSGWMLYLIPKSSVF